MTSGFSKTVFFDVDTQIDFLYPAGALYVPGPESITGNLARLNCYAAEHGNLVISTMDAHSEDDVEFLQWPHHCVLGTLGQRKPAGTLLDQQVIIPNVPGQTNIAGAQQVLLEKQTIDCFTNVNLSQMLASLGTEHFIVYGVITEICVKLAAFGLLKTGARVEIVTDAVRNLDDSVASAMLRDFVAQGGGLTTIDAVIAR